MIVVDASTLTDFLLGRVEAVEALEDATLVTSDTGLADIARRTLGDERVRHVR